MFKYGLFASTALSLVVGLNPAAMADGIVAPEPITVVSPMQKIAEYRICTGNTEGAYYLKASAMQGIISNRGEVNAVAYPADGAVDCLQKMGNGEVQAAVIQMEGLPWLQQTKSPLFSQLGLGGAVLTEEFLTFCSREDDIEDFSSVGQSDNYTVSIGGTAKSGINLALNVIAYEDDDYRSATYRYAGTLDSALREVANGFANCAIVVLDSTTPKLKELDSTYGDSVRLVGTWDSDFRTLKFANRQVYGWRAIPENLPGMTHFLSWGNDGDHWSPEVIAEKAVLVYRKDATSDKVVAAMRTAIDQVATLKTDVQD